MPSKMMWTDSSFIAADRDCRVAVPGTSIAGDATPFVLLAFFNRSRCRDFPHRLLFAVYWCALIRELFRRPFSIHTEKSIVSKPWDGTICAVWATYFIFLHRCDTLISVVSARKFTRSEYWWHLRKSQELAVSPRIQHSNAATNWILILQRQIYFWIETHIARANTNHSRIMHENAKFSGLLRKCFNYENVCPLKKSNSKNGSVQLQLITRAFYAILNWLRQIFNLHSSTRWSYTEAENAEFHFPFWFIHFRCNRLFQNSK